MRAIIQRVLNASVSVQSKQISKIDKGLCVLIGITSGDTEEDAEYIVRKILTTRYWKDPETGKDWRSNVKQIDGGVLLVSQFTLYSKFKGTKLDFHRAMGPEEAKKMFDSVVQRTKKEYQEDRVCEGQFGGYMEVNIANDGPVTTIIDSKQRDF